jgi:hypothetical protein
LDPEDPYRGWDSFFEIYHAEGPRTLQEEWVFHSLGAEYRERANRTAMQKHLIQQYKDDMWDESDSSLDSSVNVGIVSRDGSCSSFTDTDEEPFWDFKWWLFNRESAPGIPHRGRAHHEYWARWRAERRAEERRAEEQAGVHWTQLPVPVEEVLLPVSDRAPGTDTHGRAFSSDEDGDGPCVPFQNVALRIRRCFGGRNEVNDEVMTTQALRANADVSPRCEICHERCRIYDWCKFCNQGPVMHHGRCCYANPNRRN